ncbi:hypothetical protein HI914_04154 [Erysiphe necator]|nr:hypothetical protein HI914_04154 [Erysiphe necator]
MISIPPSYQEATSKKLWPEVARFVERKDLLSACLVCRKWHQIFSIRLWGNLGIHFDTDDHFTPTSLAHLGRILPSVRIEVRGLVHTLCMPSIQVSLFDAFPRGWLSYFLEYLPNLQSLIVSNLSFFDHQSLIALGQKTSLTNYPLKLLIASNCVNTTARCLSNALRYFKSLIYLDLSATQGARDSSVLSQISSLLSLCVLKMRRCGLRDNDLNSLSFPPQLRSLDISENFFTEMGVAILIDKLPKGPPAYKNEYFSNYKRINYRYADLPLSLRVSHEGIETYVLRRLTSEIDGYLQLEEGLPLTLNHFHLASNRLTINSFCRIFGHNQYLQNLDIGNLQLNRLSFYKSLIPRYHKQSTIQLLDSEIFSAIFKRLKSLRVHHSIMTSNPFAQKLKSDYDNKEGPICFKSDRSAEFDNTCNLQDQFQSSNSSNNEQSYKKKPPEMFQLLNKPIYQYYSIEADRIESRHPGRFRPQFLPNIRLLTLTGIPSHVSDFHIPNAINLFILECGEDANKFSSSSLYSDLLAKTPTPSVPRLKELKTLTLEITKEEQFTLAERNPSPVKMDKDASYEQTRFSFFQGFCNDEENDFSLGSTLEEASSIDVISIIKEKCKKLLDLHHELNNIIEFKSDLQYFSNFSSSKGGKTRYWKGGIRVNISMKDFPG